MPSCYAATAGGELAYFGGPTWEQLETSKKSDEVALMLKAPRAGRGENTSGKFNRIRKRDPNLSRTRRASTGANSGKLVRCDPLRAI